MIASRLGELEISHAAESVIEPPKPLIDWYVVAGSTLTTWPVPAADPNARDGSLLMVFPSPLPDVVVSQIWTGSPAAAADAGVIAQAACVASSRNFTPRRLPDTRSLDTVLLPCVFTNRTIVTLRPRFKFRSRRPKPGSWTCSPAPRRQR